MIEKLKDVPGVEMVVGMAWLRLGCAELGAGDIRAAADAMRDCTDTLHPLADTAEAEAAFLFPELKFYCVLLNLYLAKSPEEIKSLENTLLEVRTPRSALPPAPPTPSSRSLPPPPRGGNSHGFGARVRALRTPVATWTTCSTLAAQALWRPAAVRVHRGRPSV